MVYFELNQPEEWLHGEEDQRATRPLLSMSYVPEITTAKRKPLIHAGAVAPFNDTWQIQDGERQPAPQLTVPAELPQTIPILLVSVSQTRAGLFTSDNAASLLPSIYWSQVD